MFIFTLLDSQISQVVGTPIGFTPGQTGGIASVANFLLFLFLVAIVIAAIVRILYALGLRLGSFGDANEAQISASKRIMSTVLISVALSFSLVLISLAVNPDLVRGDVSLLGLRSSGAGATQTTTGTTQTTTQSSGNYAARLASHNAAVARLSPSGIKTNYNNAPCTEIQFTQTAPSCTSLAYLPEETIQLLLNLNASCGCTIIITGGTEPGHASHGENRRPVDLRIDASQSASDKLLNYIKGIGSPFGADSNCYSKYIWSSFTFCDEKPRTNSTWAPHLHVS